MPGTAADSPGRMKMSEGLDSRARFDFIRYANCWEDADILCAALQPAPGRRILSIASGGDNSLALAADGADVVAADLNRSQLACTELKMAAIGALDYEDVLAFLGIRACDRRLPVYASLRGRLSAPSREYLDDRRNLIAAGIVHCGKFENYFRIFRQRILPLIHRRRTVEKLLGEKDADARLDFYERTWNNLRWRWLFKLFFSRRAMGRLGRDPEFFRYVKGSVADRILARTRHALTVLPTHSNPYLDYILTGNFTSALPRYLQPSRFEAVRAGLPRLTLRQGFIQDAGREIRQGGFDGFNLSDIFEYLDPDTSARTYGALLDMANPGARLAYWNMLVPRSCPKVYAGRVTHLAELSQSLFAQDRAFFYSAFVVDEVAGTRPGAPPA
jgi:S-adenosylmethionine-diacylglycerol 3-amino-3-carboxypropyl transferase